MNEKEAHLLAKEREARRALPRWVPVGEGMPDEGREVPVAESDGTLYFVSVYKGRWSFCDCIDARRGPQITMWYDLPPATVAGDGTEETPDAKP